MTASELSPTRPRTANRALLQQYASLFRIDGVYGLLLVLAVVATLINIGMGYLERDLLRWQAPES